MKIYTESELKNKAEAYCVRTERCPEEVAQKLEQWGATEEENARPCYASTRPFHRYTPLLQSFRTR